MVIDEVVTVFDSMLMATEQALRDLRGEAGLFGNIHMNFVSDPLQLQDAHPERYGDYKDLEVGPVWDCQIWKLMPLRTYFLKSFNRGSAITGCIRPGRRGRRPLPYPAEGPDIPFTEFLAEIRGMQSGTKLSESAKALAVAIRDVEGEHEEEWTAVTISRGTANRINKQHIGAIPGTPVTFNAGISDHRPPAEDEDIGVIGIPLVVKLKLGCRIVFTKNCRGAALTCHKLLGSTLKYIVIDLSKDDEYKSPHTVHIDIERRLRTERLTKKLVFSPSAKKFDEFCREHDRLKVLHDRQVSSMKFIMLKSAFFTESDPGRFF
ncbi:hypothetical protein Pmar_PMAR016373 [Perkinsus marinus ATCC 50983]|uniref:Uncharacterized protein n=1 Tax=Perkinsus marinus (strain ATCC 50983 / TXsc) TaxID=423536 RepID=C5L8H0_PERM5|nr:hypothetical protein Pmar_PMAR016373 [Perkinsus marinus ATCC 50983]EER06959.1 hypothetical protein Pmar_PMAR016373 [Perkinsus marinus ATCC 50983]|eukprot:XP_002775143.1 hypothetical protein Pmar_PMAR016373 [Perkinsus marinus ATCC 50983]